MQSGEPLNALNLNILNLAFLLAGFLLHGTPARLMRAVQDATPAVWGVILQFPFYAGIAGIITNTHLNERLAGVFVRLSTPATFPPLVAVYSAVKRQSVQAGLVILGDLSIQGNIKAVKSLAEPLQVAMDNGARRALVPLENKRNFLDVSGGLPALNFVSPPPAAKPRISRAVAPGFSTFGEWPAPGIM